MRELFVFIDRRIRSVFSVCQRENVTFSNGMQLSSVHIGTVENGQNCAFSVNISRCDDPNNVTEGHVNSASPNEVTVQIESIQMFYGHDVIVTLNDICDNCIERFYIFDMKPTG